MSGRISRRKRREPAPRDETCLRVMDGVLVAGSAESPLPSDATSEDVLAHYLVFIRGLRRAEDVEDLPIRDDDVDALAEALGGTPSEIERRLVDLIHCSRRQARAIRKALVRRRLAVPAAGFMFSMSGFGTAVALADEAPVPVERPRTVDMTGGYVRPEPAVPSTDAPVVGEGEHITRSGSGVGDDWAEIIDPVVIAPE